MNEKLQTFIKKVSNCENPDWIRPNDISGVDYEWTFDPKDYDLPDDSDILVELFEDEDLHYSPPQEGCYHCLTISTADEIFINHEDQISFPSREEKHHPCKNWSKVKDDMQLFILTELFIADSGIGCGVYRTDYNGYCEVVDFTEEKKGFFSNDTDKFKEQLKTLDYLLGLKTRLDDSKVDVTELPEILLERIPNCFNMEIGAEVWSFEEISPTKVVVTCAVAQDKFESDLEPHLQNLESTISNVKGSNKYREVEFTLTVSLMTNTEQFMLEDSNL